MSDFSGRVRRLLIEMDQIAGVDILTRLFSCDSNRKVANTILDIFNECESTLPIDEFRIILPLFDELARADLRFVRASTEAFKEIIKEDPNAFGEYPFNTVNMYYFYWIFGSTEWNDINEDEMLATYAQLLDEYVTPVW